MALALVFLRWCVRVTAMSTHLMQWNRSLWS